MSHANGLCVCVQGRSKVGEHGRIHDLFDEAEQKLGEQGKPPNTASLASLEKAAVKAVNKGMNPPPCNKNDLEQQLQDHHKVSRQRLRADPFGKSPNPVSLSKKKSAVGISI